MVKPKDYAKNFRPLAVPEALTKLLDFDAKQDGFYSDGFELSVDDKGGIKTWSDDKDFLSCLYPIGQANGSGSTYAIWRQSGELDESPVVVFGDEGGVHVVAENVAALLQLLTIDTEPMIDDDGVTYYKDDDAEPSDGAEAYAAWVTKTFKTKPLTKTTDAERMVKSAQKSHGAAFKKWMKKFHDS